MGEGTAGVDKSTAERAADERTPRAIAERLGTEIAVVRDDLDGLVAELDRRRHDALDVRRQLGRHAFGVALTMLALLTTATGTVALSIRRQRRRARLPAQAGRLRHAIARMTEHPERVAAEATLTGKIVAAAASAAVATLVKKLLERAVQRFLKGKPDVAAAAPSAGARDHRAA
jgi:hypothetical protein